MSDVRDPDRDQVAPTPNNNASCHDLVMRDLEERKAFGLRKYNSLLQAHNGRDFVLDAYEEVLDLAVYLRGLLEEKKSLELYGPEEVDDYPDIKISAPDVDLNCRTTNVYAYKDRVNGIDIIERVRISGMLYGYPESQVQILARSNPDTIYFVMDESCD